MEATKAESPDPDDARPSRHIYSRDDYCAGLAAALNEQRIEAVTNGFEPNAEAASAEVSRLEDTLRRLTLNDEQSIRLALDTGSLSLAASRLDPKTHALTRLAALLSVGAPAASCRWSVELAQDSGATKEEIVGILLAIGPAIGLARVVAAAPTLALAIGYDVEAAFEKPAG